MLPGPMPRVVCAGRVSEALALRALSLIVGVSCLAFFLNIHKWSRSFHSSAYEGLKVVLCRDELHIHLEGNPYSQDKSPLRLTQDGLEGFSIVGYKRGLMKTPKSIIPRSSA